MNGPSNWLKSGNIFAGPLFCGKQTNVMVNYKRRKMIIDVMVFSRLAVIKTKSE